MSDIKHFSGLDKAGILFQLLGESLALTLFNGLSESDLLTIRIRSKELRHIPILVKKDIFLFDLIRSILADNSVLDKLFKKYDIK